MRFARGLAFVFRESWAFLRNGWWVAIIPSLPIPAYRLTAEWLPTNWDDAAFWGSRALAASLPAALAYCVVRFVALQHDFAAALSVNRASVRTFLPYLAVMTLINFGVSVAPIYSADIGTFLASLVVGLLVLPLLSPWTITAPSGSTVIGPVQSTKLVLPHLLWAAVFMLAVLIPIGVLQTFSNFSLYLLSGAPLSEQTQPNVLPIAIDALFNAYGELIFIIAQFVIALRAGVRVSQERTLTSVFE